MQPTHARTALVIDGDRTFRHFALRTMQRLGCMPVGLRDAHDALRWIARASCVPVVITLDPAVHTPNGRDGFSLCAQLRAHALTRTVPIVVVSSFVDVEDYVRAIDAGADEFLAKPIHPDQYAAVVDRYIVPGYPAEITLDVSTELTVLNGTH